MLRIPRKGGIAVVALAALLLASAPAFAAGPGERDTESWIVRLSRWLGLPPALTAAWEADSADVDPNGRPGSEDSAGQPAAGSDDSAHIDPLG